jgi:hypothetical protein
MPLATIMRRLLTGYVVWHNRRHERKGHLLQNRYKSIVVEEEPYFLELVRYVHLNPVRGGIVRSLSELDRNPYTGHAVIMGYRSFDCQDVAWVLGHFGRQANAARSRYRDFVNAGLSQGRREDLRGGGLVRSAGGWEQLALRSKEERELGDERILGGGSFVEEILRNQEATQAGHESNVEEILDDICDTWKVSRAQILSRSRMRRISQARRTFFLRAYEETGESMTALGRRCGLAHTSVKQAIEKALQERDER